MKKQIRVLCCKSFFSCEKTFQLHWLLIRCVHYFSPCSSIFKNTWLFLDHAYWSEMDRCTVSRWVMIFESLTCFMFGHLFSECYLQNINVDLCVFSCCVWIQRWTRYVFKLLLKQQLKFSSLCIYYDTKHVGCWQNAVLFLCCYIYWIYIQTNSTLFVFDLWKASTSSFQLRESDYCEAAGCRPDACMLSLMLRYFLSLPLGLKTDH